MGQTATTLPAQPRSTYAPNGAGLSVASSLPVAGIPLSPQQALLAKALIQAQQKKQQQLQQQAQQQTIQQALQAPTMDYTDQQRIRPASIPSASFWQNPTFQARNAGFVRLVKKSVATAPSNALEPGEQQQTMVHTLFQRFDKAGQEYLKTLLTNGKLLQRSGGEDQHSMLYHLYAMATTPRLNGMDGVRAAQDTARIVAEPEKIVQTFVKLLPQDQQDLLRRYNLHPSDLPEGQTGITLQQLQNAFSADCVPASIMVRQALQHPDELARQINELTGLGYFYETVRDWEIWPKEPGKADEIFKEWNWNSVPLGTDASGSKVYRVKFEMPESVTLRTEAAHKRNNPGNEESPIESAYQGTLAHQGSGKRYNGLLALRWDASNQLSPGLNDVEKTVLESAIEDGKAIRSIPYMVATGRWEDMKAGNTQDSFLFGYTTRFEDTLAQLTMALGMGWVPTIGFIETDGSGKVMMGHEINLVDYAVKGNEVYFKTTDTDDNNPAYVWRSAKELIPKLHHVGYPAGFAQRIQQDLDSRKGQYMRPDASDKKFFNPIVVSQSEPMDGWQDMIWDRPPEAELVPEPAPAVPAPTPIPTTVYATPPRIEDHLVPERMAYPTMPAPSQPAVPITQPADVRTVLQPIIMPVFMPPSYQQPYQHYYQQPFQTAYTNRTQTAPQFRPSFTPVPSFVAPKNVAVWPQTQPQPPQQFQQPPMVPNTNNTTSLFIPMADIPNPQQLLQQQLAQQALQPTRTN
ncbi:MAG: hypothetical protein QE263_03275 [Vampirovibrionales bacterium]|nr:hypothetical protein [Vampirovibrionales bacterium]